MVDCSDCIHNEVCSYKPASGTCAGFCCFYASNQHTETYNYASGYAAGFNMALRPRAHWVYIQYDGNPNIGNYHCSNCRWIRPKDVEMDYCGHCGADMVGVKTGEREN